MFVEPTGDDQAVVEQGTEHEPQLERRDFQRVAEMPGGLSIGLAGQQFQNAQPVPCKRRHLALGAAALGALGSQSASTHSGAKKADSSRLSQDYLDREWWRALFLAPNVIVAVFIVPVFIAPSFILPEAVLEQGQFEVPAAGDPVPFFLRKAGSLRTSDHLPPFVGHSATPPSGNPEMHLMTRRSGLESAVASPNRGVD
jgi:hypothetical protein